MFFLFFHPWFDGFFERKQVFVLFLEKSQNTILNCFYCFMQHHHFQNYAIITFYIYYGI